MLRFRSAKKNCLLQGLPICKLDCFIHLSSEETNIEAKKVHIANTFSIPLHVSWMSLLHLIAMFLIFAPTLCSLEKTKPAVSKLIFDQRSGGLLKVPTWYKAETFTNKIIPKSHLQMGVSKNRGTPKWMVYNGKPY